MHNAFRREWAQWSPRLQPYTLSLCVGILALLTIVNLRGVREPGVLFMIPTFVFVA